MRVFELMKGSEQRAKGQRERPFARPFYLFYVFDLMCEIDDVIV